MIRSWSYTHRMGSSSSSKYNCSREGTGATLQDGREISIGDSALFQAGNSPPFIGIIRSLTSGNEDCPKLGVNWLYRPADLKLNKGIFPEAAPNEVFYSFHKDEISAASLLHPCKVAFLRKGVDLPSGISSFVCRRVYDIQNRCLWWLTDQDYINERQEEVDQLLDKTQLEIHAALQSGACCLKPLNGPTSTQQLKPSSDSVQNSTTSFPSQGKGKKRDRGDHGSEPINREHKEDGHSSHCKLENMIKAEIAKITDKGRLVNCEGVDKLVHFMHLDRADKKIDLAGRIMLVDIIAATDKTECLDRFVQLRGIPVLDDWLQEAHKGKAGDSSNSPKENDESVEEFLIVLLRALDKLPVNLHALQTSNVGKSVNNLRSHKNLEIQKKARSLVDTWKKRVALEMKMNDAKSASSQNGSWPGKPGFSEVSHGANRREVAVKGIVTPPSASKTGSIKLSNVDTVVTKSTSTSPRSMKLTPSSPASVTTGSKDLHCKVAGSSSNSNLPLMTIREEKSSSSSQSQNNSESCSSDHGKNSYKEDARSSNAGSMNAKTCTGVSRTRKSSDVSLGSVVSGAQKESALGEPALLNGKTAPDKSSQAGSACERSVDMSAVDHGNGQRLIVRFPNPGRSPVRSASGGSFEDPSVIVSRASSPGISDKQDSHDRKAKVKTDTYRTTIASAANTDSLQGNDVKHGPAGSDEGDRLHVAVLDEEHIRNNVENVKSKDSSKASCSSAGNEKGFLPKSREPLKASFSMHAFIESCVKCSEGSLSLSSLSVKDDDGMDSSLSVKDDNGMDLLASVAAGEIPKSEPVSPSGTPEMNSPARNNALTSNSAKSISLHDVVVVHGNEQLDDNAYGDSEKQGKSVGSLMVRGAAEEISTHESGNILGENKSMTPFAEYKPAIMHSEEFPSPTMELHQTADLCVKSDGELSGTATDVGAGRTCSTADETSKDLKEDFPEGEGSNQLCEKRPLNTDVENNIHDAIDKKLKATNREPEDNIMVDLTCEKVAESSVVASDVVCDLLSNQCEIEQVTASCINVEKEAIEESSSCLLANEKTDMEHESLSGDLAMMKQLPPVDADHLEALGRSEDVVAAPDSNQCHEDAIEFNPEKADFADLKSKSEPSDVGWIEQPKVDHGNDSIEQNLERIEVIEHDPCGSAFDDDSINIQAPESDECMKPAVSKLSSVGADENHETKENKSPAEAFSLSNATGSDMTAKLEFNLNEGFSMDEGNPNDMVISTAAGCTSLVDLSSPMHHPVSTLHNSLHASITVATAAKGPFAHPENLLRSEGEVRWKGSASTSAFRRPAEPHKDLVMPPGTTDVTSNDTAAGNQSLPPLDIDLNMPVERVLEDMTSQSSVHESLSGSGDAINGLDLGHNMKLNSPPTVRVTGGLELDLNREDESIENGQPSSSTGRGIEVLPLPVRSSSSGGFCTGEVNSLRDFDLNNGPGVDEVGLESAPQNLLAKACGPFPSHFSGLGMNNTEVGSTSSWFPPCSSHPAVAIPSFLPDRAEQTYPFVATAGPQRILGSATGRTFGGELYRGPVFSPSPSMPFSSAVSFPYAGFPFGNNFQMASTYSGGSTTSFTYSSSGGAPSFPAVPSQLVGTAGAVSSHHPRPYVISLPEGTLASGDGSQKGSRQGLDLNSGPGSTDVTWRDERLTSLSGKLSVVNLQRLPEEQASIYQSTNGPLKRKEPEGGWDADRSICKSPSWL